MAIKSIIDVEQLDMSNPEHVSMYDDSSSVYVRTGGDPKFRRININDFFSKVSSMLSSIGLLSDKRYDEYTKPQGQCAMDAFQGNAISEDIKKSLTDAKAYTDTAIENAITKVLNAEY